MSSADVANTRFRRSLEVPQTTQAINHFSLNSLMVSHTFLSLLTPLTIALFYFSTSQSRRRPLFILNVITIILAFVVGAMSDAFAIHTLLSPLDPWPFIFNILLSFVGIWQSMFVDLILLVRLVSVYPPRQAGFTRFALLITIPVLLKLTRVANMVIFTKILVDVASKPNAVEIMVSMITNQPYLKIDWAAEMVDTSYVSLAFLWKIHDHGKKRISTRSMCSRATLAQRMRTLSHIALTNFVVPTTFSIAQFICLYHDVDPVILNILVVINTMLSTFGVTFAMIWVGSINRQDALPMNSFTKTMAITVTHYSETVRDDTK